KEIIRAGLEDHFCGKLMGVPLGVDVCYTNHAEADQDDMDTLLTLLGAAGVAYIMGVPGADDVMLNYQSTSFHDALYLREVMGLKRAPEFEEWLEKMDSRPALLSYARELEKPARDSSGFHARAYRHRPRGKRRAHPGAARLWPRARARAGCGACGT